MPAMRTHEADLCQSLSEEEDQIGVCENYVQMKRVV